MNVQKNVKKKEEIVTPHQLQENSTIETSCAGYYFLKNFFFSSSLFVLLNEHGKVENKLR